MEGIGEERMKQYGVPHGTQHAHHLPAGKVETGGPARIKRIEAQIGGQPEKKKAQLLKQVEK